MRQRIGLALALAPLAVAFVPALSACDQLTLPKPPDGGAAAPGGGDGGTADSGPLTSAQGVVPSGALLGGTKNQFGGETQTWAIVDGAGKLTELNFALPMATVNGIPATASSDVIWFLELPQVVKEQTIFRSLDFTYLPAGHAPAGVYDTPHWEWHVSTYTEAERAAVDCSDSTAPNPDSVPANWVAFPACLVGAGQHAYDLTAPEFNKERFTKSRKNFYYRGKFVGLEPSVARDVVIQRADIAFDDSPTMKVVGAKGLYPRKFKGRFDATYATYVFTYSDWIDVE